LACPTTPAIAVFLSAETRPSTLPAQHACDMPKPSFETLLKTSAYSHPL
jgi:hypothetical protein